MARRIFLVLAVLFLLAMTRFAMAESESIARFPESLVSVGEEAFAGTAIQNVVFDGNLLEIGEGAFAKNTFLQCVFLPPSLKSIADNVFAGTNDPVFLGVELTRAHIWAIKNNYRFFKWNLWKWESVHDDGTKNIVHCASVVFSVKEMNQTTCPIHRLRSMRPQDRAELHPVEFRFP